MKTYRTLFYHSVWGDGHAIDNVIALATQAWYLFRRVWKHKLSWKQFWAVLKLGLSHEEIWTPDENGGWHERLLLKNWATYTYGETIAVGKYDGSFEMYLRASGTCWTSTQGQVRGGNNVGKGTCKRNANLVLKHPERWSYTEHTVSDDAYEAMIEYLDHQVAQNKGYGLGPDKNICSELGHNANVTSGELAGPYKVIDPLGDALHMVALGKKIIPLKR